MATKYTFLPFNENGVPQAPIVTDGEPGLELLQKLVGGYIEYCPMPRDVGFEIVVNEEGKLRGMPVNQAASHVYRETWLSKHDATELSMEMTILVGPVVLVFKEDNAK